MYSKPVLKVRFKDLWCTKINLSQKREKENELAKILFKSHTFLFHPWYQSQEMRNLETDRLTLKHFFGIRLFMVDNIDILNMKVKG